MDRSFKIIIPIQLIRENSINHTIEYNIITVIIKYFAHLSMSYIPFNSHDSDRKVVIDLSSVEMGKRNQILFYYSFCEISISLLISTYLFLIRLFS